MDDRRLRSMFDAAESTNGWGRNHTLTFGREKVFVKRVPLTQVEYENPFSTRNLYGLPTYYNYGVGSAGFGVYRELAANIKTTNWVLSGEIETFPLLYHHRICRASETREPVDAEQHERYVRYWNGNADIGRYMLDRASAKHELVLFLEHIPTVLYPWLKEKPGRTSVVLDQLGRTFDFLRRKGVIHFDAHFHNILVDADRPYLTDFGLVLDKGFDLSDEEQAFFKAHTYYDYAEALSCLTFLLNDAYKALAEGDKERLRSMYGVDEETPDNQRMKILLANAKEIRAKGMMRLNADYLGSLIKYESVIAPMRGFFSGLQQNFQKDTPFPRAVLRRQLIETGYARR